MNQIHAHPSPPLLWVGAAHVGFFVAGLSVPHVVRAAGFLHFAAAIPLGIFTASIVSRLQYLGVRAAGASIALYGGYTAAIFMALAGLARRALADSDLTASVGGPAVMSGLGLLYAGVSIPSAFYKLLPRWLFWAGMALALAAELSIFALVFPAAGFLVPVARFGGFVWILATGALLPRAKPAENRRP